MLTQLPRGTKDIYAPEIYGWQWLEEILRNVSHIYGASEIRTPIFEHTELFVKNVGDTSDIVNKEMYTFEDKGGRSITLKPEGTAGVARSFIENKMYANPQPIKQYYITKCFRYEKPQAGRQREFNQYGIEVIGTYSPAADAEVISLGKEILEKLGIENVTLHINSIGNEESRALYHKALKDYLAENYDNLCPACKERYEKNPLRVLDCKVPSCKDIVDAAPSVIDYLTEEDREHFNKLKEILDSMGIAYIVDPRIVRGLDYYTRTVFEFISGDLGAQSTVCGGGRYDKMIGETGGPELGACGFAIGLERIMMILEKNNKLPEPKNKRTLYIGSIGEAGFLKSQALAYALRNKGIAADCDIVGRSVKAQLKYSDKIGSKYSMVLGDDELKNNKAGLKNMETGEVIEIELDKIAEFFLK